MALTMSVTYADFPTLEPTNSNRITGGVKTDGNIYCRPCIHRLGISFDDVKYVTKAYAKAYIFNCCTCGRRLSGKTMGIKY